MHFPRPLPTCKGKQTIIKGCTSKYRCISSCKNGRQSDGLRPDGPCGLVTKYEPGTWWQFQDDRDSSWNYILKLQKKIKTKSWRCLKLVQKKKRVKYWTARNREFTVRECATWKNQMMVVEHGKPWKISDWSPYFYEQRGLNWKGWERWLTGRLETTGLMSLVLGISFQRFTVMFWIIFASQCFYFV